MTMANLPMKRAKTDALNLEDSLACLIFPVSKESIVFNDYLKTQLETSENPGQVFLEDFSFSTYIEYFAFVFNEEKRKEGNPKNVFINWELARLANKLQNKDVFDNLMKQAEELKISKENVVDITISALENNEHECSELAELILKRCVEAVSNQKIDVWDSYTEKKEEFEKAALYLTRELGKLEGKAKEDKTEEANSSHVEDKGGDNGDSTGSKKTVPDQIQIYQLGDEEVFITYPVLKRLLALKSSLFWNDYCGAARSTAPCDDDKHLLMDEYSPEAYAEFFSLIKGEEAKKRYLYLEHNCQLIMEMLHIADSYRVDDYVEYLRALAKRVVITEKNVLYVASDALKYNEYSLTEDLCEDILKKCVEFIHYKQVDIWNDFEENDCYYDTYIYLARKLKEFQEKTKACEHGLECGMKPKCAKKEVCKNCGTLPCLKNQDVRILNSDTTYMCRFSATIVSNELINFDTIKDANNKEYKRQWLKYGCA